MTQFVIQKLKYIHIRLYSYMIIEFIMSVFGRPTYVRIHIGTHIGHYMLLKNQSYKLQYL